MPDFKKLMNLALHGLGGARSGAMFVMNVAFGLVLIMVAVLLFISILALLRVNFGDSTSLPVDMLYVTGYAHQDDLCVDDQSVTPPSYWIGKPHAKLSIHAQDFSIPQRRMTAYAILELPPDIKDELWDVKSQQFLYQHVLTFTAISTLKPQYADAALTLSIFPLAQASAFTISVPFKSEYFTHSLGTPLVKSPFDLPLDGFPNYYPSDWYSSSFSVYAQLPDNIALRDTFGAVHFTLPMDVLVCQNLTIANGWLGFERVGFNPVILGTSDSVRLVDLYVTRPVATQTFTYLVAILPILMAIVYGHYLFFYPRVKEDPLHDVIIGAATIMIAVLPLRAVLVPPEVQGFTRVDLILGLGLVLIVCLPFLKYGIHLLKILVGSESKKNDSA